MCPCRVSLRSVLAIGPQPTALETLGRDASTDEVLTAMDRDGACIVADVLSSELLSRIEREVTPWLEKASAGPDDFAGRHTARVGSSLASKLVARS